jgi:Fis family transcriptional regulator, factor for inversion stimulation protein
MPFRNAVHVLLLTADPDLAELYRHECPERVVTIAKDVATVTRKPLKHRFDAVILESHKDWMNEVKILGELLGPPPVMTLVGSTAFLRRASESVKALSTNGHEVPRAAAKLPQELGFDEYVGAKLRDFVRRMKLGAGSNLHPLLVKALEKPLISLVLEETGGNQIQAAALLGLNRNTLRKKIKELKIPLAKR